MRLNTVWTNENLFQTVKKKDKDVSLEYEMMSEKQVVL